MQTYRVYMHYVKQLSLFSFICLLAFSACKKDFEGDRTDGSLPETYLVVDSIKRSGDNRYTTTVVAHWWGSVAHGFITGYEVSTDGMQTWQYTKDQSGTFLLNLPVGQDTADVVVYVRSIDNTGAKDPTPASTAYPIKNTPPSVQISFIPGKKPLRSFPAVHVFWTASDTDGVQDIQTIEVYLNDTTRPAYTVPGTTSDLTFVANVTGGVFATDAKVYLGTRTVAQPASIDGILYNQQNKIYLRGIDRTGAKSRWAVDSIYIKKPVSDILVINAYNNAKLIPQNYYTTNLVALGGSYATFDTLQATDYDDNLKTYKDLSPDDLTQSRVLSFFKKIVWFTDDPYSLGLLQTTTSAFFNNGGKMFIATEVSGDFPAVASVFDFTPVEEFIVAPVGKTLRMNTNEQVLPYGTGWPTLKSTSIISSARPFITFSSSSGVFGYDSLYRANLITTSTQGTEVWTGPSNIMSKRTRVSTGKADIILTSLPLQRLNGNNNADSLFRKIFIDELAF